MGKYLVRGHASWGRTEWLAKFNIFYQRNVATEPRELLERGQTAFFGQALHSSARSTLFYRIALAGTDGSYIIIYKTHSRWLLKLISQQKEAKFTLASSVSIMILLRFSTLQWWHFTLCFSIYRTYFVNSIIFKDILTENCRVHSVWQKPEICSSSWAGTQRFYFAGNIHKGIESSTVKTVSQFLFG